MLILETFFYFITTLLTQTNFFKDFFSRKERKKGLKQQKNISNVSRGKKEKKRELVAAND
jgi:hypothetical protein